MVFESFTTTELFIVFLSVLAFFAMGGVVAFLIFNRLLWPVKVVILEPIANTENYGISRRDRARLIKFGDGGEEIYFLKKSKKYRVAYGKKIGKNLIAWAIGSDGYWYNITFGDLNKKLLEVDVRPTDRDMRYASASVRKGIDTGWKSKGFYEKWGVPITLGILIFGMFVQGGITWFLLDKMQETSATVNEGIEQTGPVLETLNQILNKLNLLNQDSGIRPATDG